MSGPIAPLIPAIRMPAATSQPASSAPSRGPLPLPKLGVRRTSASVYGLSSVDNRGRLVDTRVMRELAWSPDLPLTWTAIRGALVVTPDTAGVSRLTPKGHVRIPAPLRHLCALTTGDRVLLATDPISSRLTIYPPATLDILLSDGAGL